MLRATKTSHVRQWNQLAVWGGATNFQTDHDVNLLVFMWMCFDKSFRGSTTKGGFIKWLLSQSLRLTQSYTFATLTTPGKANPYFCRTLYLTKHNSLKHLGGVFKLIARA